jgi:DNA-binding transcriptional LysR family regulator
MAGRLDWEDLHTVLAVADTGSLAAAARRLGVNHTTVLRRIGGFEQRLGLRLFDRLPGGYALTAGGEELVAAARGMAATVETLERRLAGQDLRLDGTLRVATADTLMASILPPLLAQFRDLHPGITIEITTANLLANLTRRDADVAIRTAPDPPETLVGRRVAGIAFAVYAAAEYSDHSWVAPDDSLAGTAVARWMRQAVPDAVVALRADSLVGMCRAAQAGLGLAALPCYLGDTAGGLVRVPMPTVPAETALWVLTHEDLRRTARVSAFTEFIAAALARQRDLLEGRRPAVAS